MSKVPWGYKIVAFVASVIALSWFFAGWRQVNEASNLANWALLAAGTLSTIFLLGLQGYWIYFEEESKGTLKRRIALFDSIHARLNSPGGKQNDNSVAAIDPATSTQSSSCAKKTKGA